MMWESEERCRKVERCRQTQRPPDAHTKPLVKLLHIAFTELVVTVPCAVVHHLNFQAGDLGSLPQKAMTTARQDGLDE